MMFSRLLNFAYNKEFDPNFEPFSSVKSKSRVCYC